MPQPQPGNLDHDRSQPGIAGLGDALVPMGHGDDLRQILIQGRSDSVLLIASGVDGIEPVARKTAGFLVSVQLSQLGAGNRQKTRCAYQCEIAPWRPSLLVVSRPCSSATSGSQRVTAARHWHRSATPYSAPAWNPTGSTRISPPGAMTPVRVSPPASRRCNPATRSCSGNWTGSGET